MSGGTAVGSQEFPPVGTFPQEDELPPSGTTRRTRDASSADLMINGSATTDPSPAPRHRIRRRLIPLDGHGDIRLGVLAALLCMIGSWYVSTWLDESATAHIISYPPAQMNGLFTWTDLVYAPYYYLMHYWTALVGINPLTLRLPSVLAVGVGTAAMAATGRVLVARRGQLLYAACFVLLPRVMAMGIEARPYAFAAMFVACAVWLVVLIGRRPTACRVIGLTAAMALAVYAQMYAVLPVIGLTLVGLLTIRTRHRWLVAAAAVAAGTLCLPFGVAAVGQLRQVEWIANLSHDWFDHALVESWAASRTNVNVTATDLVPHVIAVTMAVLAALLVVLALVSRFSGTAAERAGRRPGVARMLWAMVPIVLTVVVLWTYSLLATDVLLARYFTAVAPFYAVVLAEATMALRWGRARVVPVLLLVGALALAGFQRRPYAKVTWEDYSLLATVMRTEAQPGDGLLTERNPQPNENYQVALACDPDAFAHVVNLAQPNKPPLDGPFRRDPPRIRLVTYPQLPQRIWLAVPFGQWSEYGQQLEHLGYQPTLTERGPQGDPGGHAITLWQRR